MMTEQGDPLLLLVDDDPVTRVRVRSALEAFGYPAPIEAEDGTAAQDLLREHPELDLVITDIMMPGLDGIELLKWGREHVPGPVWILLSGLDTFDAAVEAIRQGAFDFLAKPPQLEELEVSVRNALEQRRLLRERDRLHAELEETNRQLLSKVRDLEDKSELLRRDLQRAEVIQRALLPTTPPSIERFCVQAVHRPGQYVGGDLYDMLWLTGRHVGIYVADATGHGVTAAMLSVLYKQQLKLVDESSGRPLAPAAVLEAANRALVEAVRAPGLFVTAVYCLLDTVDGVVTLASAGHPPVVHAQADGETHLIQRTGPALGLTTDAEFGEERFRLEGDDRLLLYTDGLLQSGTGPELDRLRLLLSSDTASVDTMLEKLLDEAAEPAAGEEDRDDVTLLLLEVHAGPSRFDNGAAGPVRRRAGAPTAPHGDVVFYGEDEEASYLAVRGRAIWMHCDGLYAAASGILETGRPLVLDLSACDYLDSTCLGTIHELVSRGDVRLQGVQEPVRALFEELDMEQVLANIRESGALPELHPLAAAEGGEKAGPLRILRAHEALAALSARNREKFQEVVDALRTELAEDSGGRV